MAAVIEKYTKKINIIFALAGILLALLMGVSMDNVLNLRQSDTGVEIWSPEAVQTEDGYDLSFVLPVKKIAGECIAFHSSHIEAEVYIAGEKVYALHSPKSKLAKSTGYRWNFIMLNPGDSGKSVTIHIKNVYESSTVIKEIYYGTEIAIFRAVADSGLFSLLLACVILFTGLVSGIYAMCTAINNGINRQLFSFSLFAVALGVWAVAESPIADLLSPSPFANVAFSHYALMFMPITYVRYIKPMFSQKRYFIWDSYLIFDCFIIALRTLMQFTSFWDLKQSLWMTHISIAVFVLVGFVMCVCELREKNIDKQVKLNIMFILITLSATVVELVLFAMYGECTVYGMICFVAYVVINTTQMIKRSQLLEKKANEAEIYHSLAYTDALTGIYNRMALMRDIADENVSNTSSTLIMIDLNDLKSCNDGFGHEYGDRYIKTVATALFDSFGDVGNCYRIGGDEFCVLMHGADCSEVDKRLSLFNEKIDKVNNDGFVVSIGAAVGCAFFDNLLDKSLSDTMKRADAEMYKNKQIIKQV